MQSTTKSFIINIITIALVITLVIVGYVMFTRNKDTVSEIVTPPETINETIMVGIEISKTFNDLDELKVAVEDARTMIGSPVFQTLKDFSVTIPPERVGRANPFIPASWKVMKKE